MASIAAWFLTEFREVFEVSGCQNPSVNKRFTNMSAHPSAHLCVHGVSLHGKYRYYFNKVVKFTLKKFIYASKLHTKGFLYELIINFRYKKPFVEHIIYDMLFDYVKNLSQIACAIFISFLSSPLQELLAVEPRRSRRVKAGDRGLQYRGVRWL